MKRTNFGATDVHTQIDFRYPKPEPGIDVNEIEY